MSKNAISRQEYVNNLLSDAQHYNRTNSASDWAQYSTVKERAIALANNHLAHYKEYNDVDGCVYAEYALKVFKRM